MPAAPSGYMFNSTVAIVEFLGLGYNQVRHWLAFCRKAFVDYSLWLRAV
jgi:hypothetical protein